MTPDQSQPSRRLQRIASRLKFLVSQVIQNELSDPRIGFVTVLEVEPTEDMKEAKVYLSFLGNQGERSKTEHALASARGFIQREVGKNLKTRNTPHLHFIFDDTRDKVARLEALIDETAQKDRESKMTKPSRSKVDDEFEEGDYEADWDSDGDDGDED